MTRELLSVELLTEFLTGSFQHTGRSASARLPVAGALIYVDPPT